MMDHSIADILGVKVDIGVEAENFLKSEIGLAVVGRQRAEIAELHSQLENLSLPVDKIRELQMDIAARRRALGWLLESIDEAKNAAQSLEQLEAED